MPFSLPLFIVVAFVLFVVLTLKAVPVSLSFLWKYTNNIDKTQQQDWIPFQPLIIVTRARKLLVNA